MLWSLILLGCHPSGGKDAAPLLSPDRGSSAGYFTVEADLSALDLAAADVTGLTLAGITALDRHVTEDGALSFMVQGAPDPGDAELVLLSAEGEQRFSGVFAYDPPLDPVFDRVQSIGASLSMGAISAAVSPEGGMTSAPARIAAQTGAFMGLPLLVPRLVAPITVADLDGGCDFPSYSDHINAQVTAILSALNNPDTGEADPRLGRLDPDIEVRNRAVSGTNISEFLDINEVGLSEVVFGHIVNEPDAGLFDPLSFSQLDLVEADAPTLILALDPLVNDGVDAVTSGETLTRAGVTSTEELEEGLRAFVARLAATGAEVFIGNSPRPSALPIASQAAAHMIAAGDTEEYVADELAAIDAGVAAQNALLASAAADWPNVHVVDFAGSVDALAADGLDVGGTHLTTDAFGGLVGLDGIHYTTTGYAVMANLTLSAMRETLGLEIEDLDLEEVLASDPLSPDALAAAGFNAAACE